jgi:pyruvate,orthophosphate dikinase
MFFAEDRLPIMREMILAKDENERRTALSKLLPMQKQDFSGLFKAMDGLPVTIRLLDPPLHEFLPSHEELLVELTTLKATKGDKDKIDELEKLLHKVESLKEANPMLGHRGCRLGVIYPEVSEMQARAIFEAACELTKEGYKVLPEVMIPLVGTLKELKLQKELIDIVAKETFEKYGVEVDYKVGTMIELPRAAITADKIAQEAEFFSFGTNDLTQTTFGFSRDDAEGKFLDRYLEKGVLEQNPFEVLDREGVGELVRIGTEKGRKTRPDLKVGICGEHGGEPNSIEFCHIINMTYVSCSPYRVPIARLAAAQAKIKNG